MAKTRIGTNAQFVGPNQGLSTIGDHCYGLSGSFSFTDTVAYGLNFSTGKGYIEAKIYFGYHDPSGDNVETHVVFNNQIVFQAESNQSLSGDFPNGFAHLKIIIPPYTTVKIGAINVSNSNAHTSTISLTGKVYA